MQKFLKRFGTKIAQYYISSNFKQKSNPDLIITYAYKKRLSFILQDMILFTMRHLLMLCASLSFAPSSQAQYAGTSVTSSDQTSITCSVYDSSIKLHVANPVYDNISAYFIALVEDSSWEPDLKENLIKYQKLRFLKDTIIPAIYAQQINLHFDRYLTLDTWTEMQRAPHPVTNSIQTLMQSTGISNPVDLIRIIASHDAIFAKNAFIDRNAVLMYDMTDAVFTELNFSEDMILYYQIFCTTTLILKNTIGSTIRATGFISSNHNDLYGCCLHVYKKFEDLVVTMHTYKLYKLITEYMKESIKLFQSEFQSADSIQEFKTSIQEFKTEIEKRNELLKIMIQKIETKSEFFKISFTMNTSPNVVTDTNRTTVASYLAR